MAPRAVLSAQNQGLFLPRGFTLDERSEPRSAFAVFDANGVLSTTRGMRRIEYEDLVESRERLVLTHYAEHAPPALRPFVMALLAALSANAR